MKFETRLTDELIARHEKLGHWGSETFYSVLAARAASHPDRVAIVDRGRRITYGELKTRVDRVAAGFKALGIGSGDVVTIQLPNWVEFAYVFFALERLGAVANQIGPDFRSREVDYILRFSESRAFVCPSSFKSFDYVKMISALRPGLPDLEAVCVLGRRSRRGRQRRPAFRCRPAGERRHADGLHFGHDREPEGRDPQPQHHALDVPDLEH